MVNYVLKYTNNIYIKKNKNKNYIKYIHKFLNYKKNTTFTLHLYDNMNFENIQDHMNILNITKSKYLYINPKKITSSNYITFNNKYNIFNNSSICNVLINNYSLNNLCISFTD
jgi:hypothetical protein